MRNDRLETTVRRLGISLIYAFVLSNAAVARAQEPEERALQLVVSIRGTPVGLIGTFRQLDDNAISARRQDLEALGLRVPDRFGPNDYVRLEDLPGVRFLFDETLQAIDFDVEDSGRLPKQFDALRGTILPGQVAQSSTGLVVNYLVFGAADRLGRAERREDRKDFFEQFQFRGVSTSIDARLFSALGVVSQSAIVTAQLFDDRVADILRLDSTYSFSDPDDSVTYRAGDTISGALPWTRPIRLGGAQVQRNFGLRPDLLVIPLPNVSGSAAVPSTVDIFLNGVRTVTQDVTGGPFRITNIPILSGQGNARVVVRDVTGREIETTLPFFVSGKLLRAGLFDFSAEAGFPRLSFGTESDSYADKFSGSGTIRYGITDDFTLESHAEATAGLINGGVGMTAVVEPLGLFSTAVAGSSRESSNGGLFFGSFETTVGGIFLNASTQRTFGKYDDLASVTAEPLRRIVPPGLVTGVIPTEFFLFDNSRSTARQPRAVDRVSASFLIPFEAAGTVNLGYIRAERANGARTQIVNASYSRPFLSVGSVFATAFADLEDRRNSGVFAGLSVPLGDKVTASAGVSGGRNGTLVTAELARRLDQSVDSYGYRIRDTEGRLSRRSASLAYRGGLAQVEGTVVQGRDELSGSAQVEGAVVVAGGGVFLSPRVDDAFAIANIGVPDVEVLFENRPVVRTNDAGRALVPGLRAYQTNRLSIDPRNLPLNASIGSVREVVVPADRSGVVVDFNIRTEVPSAVVILTGGDGKPLKAGLQGLTGNGRAFVVGFDGRAFIEDLDPNNSVVVDLPQGQCRTEFPFSPREGEQVVIGPLVCL